MTDNFINKPGGLGALQAYPYLTSDPIGMKAGAQYNYYTGQAIKTFAMRPNQSAEEQVTTTTYDFADRPLRTTSPTGSYVELGYWDNILRQTTYTKRDVVNGVDQLVYSWQDFNGAGMARRKGSDHPNGGTGKYVGQQFKYDELGRGNEQSNMLAVTSSFAIDNTEPGQTYTYLQWSWTTAEFDGLGRTASVEKPDSTYIFTDFSVCGCAGGLTTDNYDERNNRKATQTDFLGRLQYARELEPYIDYDTNGQPYIADYTIRAEVEYQYDELDRITNIIHRGNGSVMASSGQHLTGTGQTRSFAYDLYGRAQSETTPEAGTISYTYTTNDQIATTTNANSKVTTVSYNSRNLVTGISYNDSTPSVSYSYDDYGARNAMTDGEGAMSYVYDSFRRLQSETRTFTGLGSNNYTFNYSYNLGGQLTQANYVAPSFNKNINYAYNSKGALNGIGTNLIGSDPTTTTNVISGMSYRAFGAASSISYGNNRTATLSYDVDLMRMTNMVVARPDGTDEIVRNSYYYTDNGLIYWIHNTVDYTYSASYSFNYRNQMTNYARNYSSWAHTYDDWGNMTAGGSSGYGVTYSYTKISGTQVPATNRLSSMTVTYGATTNFTYDNAGNMISAGSTTYQWDAANRLKSVNNGSIGSYGYDGNGKRVKKTESGTTTYYVESSVFRGAVLEVNQNAAIQRATVVGLGGVVARLSSDGQFYWQHREMYSNSTKLTNGSGAVAYRGEFDPYGNILLETGASGLLTQKYGDYERDASGLDQARARMYTGMQGRFISPDPMGIRSANLTAPKSLNRYSYVQNDPINFKDPGGLKRCPKDYVKADGTLVINTCISDPGGGGGSADDQIEIEEPGDSDDGGGPIVTSDAQTILDSFKNIPQACFTVFDKAGFLSADMVNSLKSGSLRNITLINMSENPNAYITGLPDKIKTAQMFWDEAAGDPDAVAKTIISHGVILLSKEFYSPGIITTVHYGGKVAFQSIVLFHEFAHAFTKLGDVALASKLKEAGAMIGDFDAKTASTEISEWVNDGCKYRASTTRNNSTTR